MKNLKITCLIFAAILFFIPTLAQADAQRIYFSDSSTQVSRVEDDGANLTTIVSGNVSSRLIAVDSHQRYLFALDTAVGSSLGSIVRYKLDGTGATTVVPSVVSPASIAVDGTNQKLYWSGVAVNNTAFINRSDLDGGNVQTVTTATINTIGEKLTDLSIDPDNHKVYWLETIGTASIQRINTDGSGATDTIITLNNLTPSTLHFTLDAAGGYVYWSNVSRQNISRNTIVNPAAIAEIVYQERNSQFAPVSVLFDSSSKGDLFIGDSGNAAIERLAVGAGTLTDIVDNINPKSLGLVLPVPIVPGTAPIDPPDFILPSSGTLVTFILQPFDASSFSSAALRPTLAGTVSAAATSQSIRYDLTVTRSDGLKRRRILKNAKGTLNLPAGTFTASYNGRLVQSLSRSKKRSAVDSANRQITDLKGRSQTTKIKNRIQDLIAKRSLAGLKTVGKTAQSGSSATFTVN